MAGSMTQEQFKEALEDTLALMTSLAQEFPDEISEHILAHLGHCLGNPLALKLLFESLDRQKKVGQKKAV